MVTGFIFSKISVALLPYAAPLFTVVMFELRAMLYAPVLPVLVLMSLVSEEFAAPGYLKPPSPSFELKRAFSAPHPIC